MRRGVFGNLGARYVSLMLTLGSTMLLARLLSPGDFGVVALIQAVSGLFAIIGTAGLSAAVVQNRALGERDIAALFGLSAVMAGVVFVVFLSVAVVVAIVLNDWIYACLGLISSTTLALTVLNAVPSGVLLSEGRLGAVGLRQLIGTVLGVSGAILAAFVGLGPASLLLVSFWVALSMFVGNWAETRLPLKFRIPRSVVAKIAGFSMYDYASSLTRYLARNVDGLLVGMIMGPASLGVYSQALVLTNYPVSNVTFVINPLLLPILSRNQSLPNVVFAQYVRVFRLLSLIGIVVGAIAFGAAHDIIIVVLGSRWIDAVVPFQILSLGIWFQMCVVSAGPVFQSMGATRAMFRSGLSVSLVAISLAVLGAVSGSLAVLSSGVLLGVIVKFLIEYRYLMRACFSRSIGSMLSQVRAHSIVAVMTFGVSILLQTGVDVPEGVPALTVKLLGVVVVFAVCVKATGEWTRVRRDFAAGAE
ncbi:oligosaccharide flippase family protein [Tessaracoccus sp. Y1736]